MPGKEENRLGAAMAKRTGECRIMTADAYLELDASSEARWEFHAFELDPRTGEPTAASWSGSGSLRAGLPSSRDLRWRCRPGSSGTASQSKRTDDIGSREGYDA